MPSILLIDDDVSVCQAAEEALTGSGFSVTIAPDGRAGINAATRQPFAAAIVDMCTPHLQGFDTIRTFRQVMPDLPLIAMSSRIADWAGNTPDFLGMAANLQGVHRLSKPFRHEDLLDLVSRCCAPLLEPQSA